MATTYGRNRQSIADIEQRLNDIFNKHPRSQLNEAGDPVIPGDALVDVFSAFSEIDHGVELMTDDEMGMLKALLASNPGLEVTPQILIQFIAERSKHSPQESPEDSPYESDASQDRGRSSDWELANGKTRSSSGESSGNAVFTSSRSRPPSRGPAQPPPSPFDLSKRQRSAPLSSGVPSSWNRRPAPVYRRRSDAGQYATSDSEFGPSSSRGNRTPSRSRAPSSPTSPKSSFHPDLDSFSPHSPPSRPHSRSQSHFIPMSFSTSAPAMYGSPGSPSFRDTASPTAFGSDDGFSNSISLPMPRSPDSDSDSEAEDSTLGLVLDRSRTSSTISLEPMEIETLQRTNAELGKKLMEAEQALQRSLDDHEQELEELQSHLEEVKSELSATKREEKELRAKERQYTTQISSLETEIVKLQKSLDIARTSYQTLQKQYQEQCAESERYRNSLRVRDREIKEHKDGAALQQIEIQKWTQERETYEDRIAHLETELTVAQQASLLLDEQKQETLMLKETIDRMRFEMDELRYSAVNDKSGSSGTASIVGSVSKSLGAELAGKLNVAQWGLEGEDLAALENGVEVEREEAEVTEREDVVQTIITRKKRKVPSRANRIQTQTFMEVREYSDAYTQHEPFEFTSSSATQTTPEPKVSKASFSTQTDDKPLKLTMEFATQTERAELDHTAPSPSSSAAPTASEGLDRELPHPDLPPAYEDEVGWLQLAGAIKKWHKGAELPLQGVPGGVSEDALEGWKTVQEEVGVGCVVMDKILEKSERTGARRRPSATGKGRLYNIYNTYVYGKDGSSSFTPAAHALMCAGASALMLLVMTPFMVPHYNVPGSPTYYDRAAWASFNSMQVGGEGFAADGTNAVWSFLGTIGGGAARIVRGWPT